MRRYLPTPPPPLASRRPLVPPPPVARPPVPLLITTPPQAPRRPIPLIAPAPVEAAPRRPMPPLAPTPTRRPLVPIAPPPSPQATAPRRAPVVVPAKAPRLPLGLWPSRVFGRHPVSGEVIAIQHGIAGYFQIGDHVDPAERNRQSGVPEEVAQAVIVTAFQETEDGGTVWAGSGAIDWNATE